MSGAHPDNSVTLAVRGALCWEKIVEVKRAIPGKKLGKAHSKLYLLKSILFGRHYLNACL